MSNNSKLTPKLRFPEFRDEWNDAKLNDVGDIVGERISLGSVALKDYVTTENILPDFGEITLASNLPSTGSVTHFRTNDVLISNIRPYLKKVWASDRDGGASNDVIVIRAKSVLRTDFFACVLRNESFIAHVMKGAKGVKMPRGDIGLMMEYPVPYPSPTEQQKIAACLGSLDEMIAAERRKWELLRAFKKGLIQQLFPRDGETTPLLRFPEFQGKGEWEESLFFDLLEDIYDFRGRTPKKLGMEWGGGSIVSLSANNVKNGYIDFCAECYLGSEALFARWMGDVQLRKGDIVFTMEAPLGNALLVPDDQKYILSQRVVAFKTKPHVRNEFLIQLMWSAGFQDAVNFLATGSTAKGISQKALEKVSVLVPGPAEQQRIAACLSSLDAVIAAQARNLEGLKSHKKGLMQQLFPSAAEVSHGG